MILIFTNGEQIFCITLYYEANSELFQAKDSDIRDKNNEGRLFRLDSEYALLKDGYYQQARQKYEHATQ
jgi:hypothetical protein